MLVLLLDGRRRRRRRATPRTTVGLLGRRRAPGRRRARGGLTPGDPTPASRCPRRPAQGSVPRPSASSAWVGTCPASPAGSRTRARRSARRRRSPNRAVPGARWRWRPSAWRVLPARATNTTPSARGRSGTTSPATTSGAQSRMTTSVSFFSRSPSALHRDGTRGAHPDVRGSDRSAARRPDRIEHGSRYGVRSSGSVGSARPFVDRSASMSPGCGRDVEHLVDRRAPKVAGDDEHAVAGLRVGGRQVRGDGGLAVTSLGAGDEDRLPA